MKSLYVLHDPQCGFCERCRDWLGRQPAYVELRFVPMNSTEAQRQFPGIEKHWFGEDLMVISDEGAVYRGPSAYLMCLYALVEYREWAQRLASPALLPLARRVFHLLSKQRLRLSRWFFSGNAKDIERRLGPEETIACERLRPHGDPQNRRSARRTWTEPTANP